MEDDVSMDGLGGVCSSCSESDGGMVQEVMRAMGNDGERAMNLCSLAPLLTSCCAAWFLTGRGPAPVRGPGVGDPCYKGHKIFS